MLLNNEKLSSTLKSTQHYLGGNLNPDNHTHPPHPHSDIKPENLLLMDDAPDAALKIADFGVACWLNELDKGPNKYLKCGTPGCTGA